MLMAGCSQGTATKPPQLHQSPGTASVRVAARTFMVDFVHQKWNSQWRLLAPAAQSQWPSEQVRTQMLASKFGDLKIQGFTMGSMTDGALWVSRENLARITGLWKVAVGVQFAAPTALDPTGVASAYANLDLYLTAATSHQAPLVVGEGPASLDAPIIIPGNIVPHVSKVPILMYHRVGAQPIRSQYTSAYGYAVDVGLTVSPKEFDQQMAYLHQAGYHSISLTQLADHLLYGLALPAKPVILTFDDGRRSVWYNAVPVMQRYGFTADFFVPAALVGSVHGPQQFLTWSQLEAMTADGFWIEDHTMYDNVVLWTVHMSVAQLQVLTDYSKQLLEQHTAQPIQFIAYSGPWPNCSALQAGPNRELLFRRLQNFGYVGGVVDAADNYVEMSNHLWQIARIRVVPGEALSFFRYLLQVGSPGPCG